MGYLPLLVFLYMVEVGADSRGYYGKTIVQVRFLVLFAVASVCDRRAKRKNAEVEASGRGRHLHRPLHLPKSRNSRYGEPIYGSGD